MKKLYKKGKVHPTPPLISDHFLTFLPATILTLATTLSPQDKEVLAYLISCSGTPPSKPKKKSLGGSTSSSGNGVAMSVNAAEHVPMFNCNCFSCYTSYWARWDASPNRQLIHDIIDAFEDELVGQKKKIKNKKDRRKKGYNESDELMKHEESVGSTSRVDESGEVDKEEVGSSGDGDRVGGEDGEVEEEEMEKGSVRKFMSFLGERFWGVWGE